MFRLADGRDYLYQWDTNVKLLVDDTINEVHFAKRYHMNTYTVQVLVSDTERYVRIPNILLEDTYDLLVYGFIYDDNGNRTKCDKTFTIEPRIKPDGYVYTESEVLNYHSLDERLKYIEENGVGGGIVIEKDPTVPAWAKEKNKPTYNASEVGAYSKDEINNMLGSYVTDIANLIGGIEE